MIIEKVEKLNNFILKNMLYMIVVLVLLYLFLGRNNSEIQPIQYDTINSRAMTANAPSPMLMAVRSKGVENSKMVKSYALSIETKNVNKVKESIISKVNDDNGIVESFFSYNYYGDELAYNYSLKIPTDKINETINYFKTLGLVKNESSSGIEMEEQYSDNKNRLTNLYARRDRLRQMMSNKTEKLADIIAVDRELNSVQNEIEMLENANKNIDNNVSFSRVELSIIPEIKVNNFNNSKWQANTSWKKAVNELVIFGQKTVDFTFIAMVFAPVVICFIILFMMIKFVIIKIKK